MSGIKLMTPVGATSFINKIAAQRLGEEALSKIDTSNIVAVADLIYKTGMDTVIKDIYTLVGTMINKVRSYDGGKYASVMVDSDEFNNRMAVVKFYSDEAIETGSMNTDIHPNNIVNGADPESDGRSQYKMKFSPVLEMFFDGGNTWSYQLPTRTEDEWYSYFRNPAEFASFFNGMMTEALNDLNYRKEGMAQAVVLNHMAGVYQMVQDGEMGPECLVDLIALFNKKCHTQYSRTEILTEHLDDFLKIVAAKLDVDSRRLTNRSIKYHWNPTKVVGGKSYKLRQHTPYASQRGFFYGPLISEAETRVLPTIFNADMLKNVVGKNTASAEMIDSWQALDTGDDFDGAKIHVECAIPTSNVKKEVELDFVFGMIYDEQAIKVVNKFEHSRSTPVHAVAGTIETYFTFFKNAIDDFTDNTILYILGPGEAKEDEVVVASEEAEEAQD